MKKILFITILLYTTNANALSTTSCMYTQPSSPCKEGKYPCTATDDSGCPPEQEECIAKAPEQITQNGVRQTTKYIWRQGCAIADQTTTMCLCDLSDISTYDCAPGYYGSATSFTSHTCTECPTGAACLGGNNSTFICPSDTLKTSTECTDCPQYATCNGGTTFTCKTDFTKSGNTCICNGYIVNDQCYTCPPNATCKDGEIICNQNYYLDNDSCLACPYNGITTTAGATQLSDCYIPSARNINLLNGTGHFANDCKATM